MHNIHELLQYDAKLLKLQKQTSKVQSTQPSTSVNNEIFRRVITYQCSSDALLKPLGLMQKLQNIQADSQREVTTLKRRVQELERQLSLASKRRKF